jgi:hypothetical protein
VAIQFLLNNTYAYIIKNKNNFENQEFRASGLKYPTSRCFGLKGFTGETPVTPNNEASSMTNAKLVKI